MASSIVNRRPVAVPRPERSASAAAGAIGRGAFAQEGRESPTRRAASQAARTRAGDLCLD